MESTTGTSYSSKVYYLRSANSLNIRNVLQQDDAPAHPAHDTVRFLEKLTPDFIPPTLWPPNSPDLNPVDYKIWDLLKERIYKTKVRDVEGLRERILEACDELEQSVIDTSVNQWRERLSARVAAQGGKLFNEVLNITVFHRARPKVCSQTFKLFLLFCSRLCRHIKSL